jgi:parallel beta-helix repeat protein
MRSSVFAIILGAMMLFSVLPAAAQLAEPRGLRPDVVYGGDKHFVTLTFYIGQNGGARLQEILEVLQSGNVSKAVFFIQPIFLQNNPAVASTMEQMGYTVLPWNDISRYDQNYAPTSFDGILLSDRDVLGRTNKTADVMAFYNLALHSSNASVVAFTPSALPRFNATTDILEELLENGGRTLSFTDRGNAAPPASMVVGSADNVPNTPIGTNTTYTIVIDEGLWDMQRLQQRYPSDIRLVQTSLGPGYLVDTTIVVGEAAQLDISGQNVLIESPTQDNDRRIEVRGRATIADSFVSSWDSAANAPDQNPYHQRPFIFADGGRLDISNSTISYMGFPISGLSEVRSARAAIMFQDTSNFTIANSTISSNFDGIYARNSSGFQITNNDVYGNTRFGIDIRASSHDFVMNSNHVHDNWYEGITCTECTGVNMAGNIVEHNEEAGIKLFWHTNSTDVNNNIVRFNEKFGVHLKDNVTGNVVRNNTITDGEEGITLTGSSTNNTIVNNMVAGNDITIVADPSSQTNTFRANRLNSTQPG